MRVPFCPLPTDKALSVSQRFLGISTRVSVMFPNLGLQLRQADIDMEPRQYLSIAIFTSLFIFGLIFFPIVLLSLGDIVRGFLVSFTAAFLLGGLAFLYISIYPKRLVNRKVADLEGNLLFALKHLLIQVRSGVSIFDAMVSVSMERYGLVSKQFGYVVKKVNGGTPTEEALEDLAIENPSVFFRRAIRQVSNGVKVGSDLGDVLQSIIYNVEEEEKIAIRKYGSQLNPLTLAYMMIAVIIPSLGVTFLIVLSAFMGTAVSENMLWMILGGTALFQFMFLGLIKSRRPNLAR